MRTKKIKFASANTSIEIPAPKPASLSIPKWFKQMPGVTKGVMGVKKCVPFIDAFAAGYVITLPSDMVWDEAAKKFNTGSVIELNSDHYASQVEGIELGSRWDSQPHKWINMWHIKLPKGYSALFTHPHNRDDLPFRSFTGVVDADKHPLIINFPFVLEKGFSGVIPAGTPIIQILPFKREKWVSEVKDTGGSYVYEKAYEVLNPPFGFYKRRFWTRKFFS